MFINYVLLLYLVMAIVFVCSCCVRNSCIVSLLSGVFHPSIHALYCPVVTLIVPGMVALVS